MNQLTPNARPEIGREIATTADGIDITRGYTGPLLAPYDSVLRARGNNDLLIYEAVLSDDEVKSALNQRMLAVTQCEWDVEPGGKRAIDKAAAEDLKKNLHAVGWDNVTTKMLYGVFYGYGVAEVLYKPVGSRIAIDTIKVRNRRRFRYGKEGDLRLLTMHNMHEGIPAEKPYFWDFCCGADNDDEPYGLGLAHWLYWPVLFKRNGLKFWLIFLEKFGMPTAVGKYDPETSDDAERNKLLRATRAIQVDSGIIIPKEMELSLLEAARSGTADYKILYDTMNAAIQKVILGQTASTQGTPGKLGNDDLAGDVRKDIIKADADLVCESFNLGPARWLTEWNFPGAALPRVYRVTEEPEDLDTLAARDEKVSRLGFKRTLQSVTTIYGDGWEEKQAPVMDDPLADVTRPDTAIDGASFSEPERAVLNLLRRHGVQFTEGTAAKDPSVPMAAQLDKAIAPTGRKWNDQVRDAVDKAASLEELEQLLLKLAPDLSLDEYADAFAQAMTAAQLAGRYDMLQD